MTHAVPIEQPTKFELVLNLKTAKTIRLTISPVILVRVDDDPADERRKSAVGCAAHFLVYPLDFVGHYASARLYAAIIGSAAERRAIR